MRPALILASALILVLGAVHSVLGERYILIRLFRRADLPRLFGSDVFTRRTLRFAWHLTTVVWLGVAALLLVAADVDVGGGGPSLATVGTVIAATALASALVTVVGSRARHPAWVIFLVVAACVWVGTR